MRIVSIIVILSFFFSSLPAQSTITGKVIDANSKEGLSFATITIPNTLFGTVTNIDGEFDLKLTEKVDKVQASYIGYADQIIDLKEVSKDIFCLLYTSPSPRD